MTTISIPDELAGRIDWEQAVRLSLQEPSALLPPATFESAIADHVSDYAEWAAASWRKGVMTHQPEVVFAAKPSRGLRPVPVLSLLHRVVYRGVVGLLEPQLPQQSRVRMSFDEFQLAPLDQSDASFVLVTDITNFYEYIDHQLLQDELVARTAEGTIARFIRTFLGELAGRSFGIPQTYGSSHVLSDIILEVPENRLLRSGYEVWRFGDDFRVGAETWSSISSVYEQLDYEVRQLGLSLSDAKSYRFPRARYMERLEAPNRIWRTVAGEVEADLRIFNPYTEVVVEPDEEATLVEASLRFLELWSDGAATRQDDHPVEAYAYRDVLGSALAVLMSFKHDGAIAYLRDVLVYEPFLTNLVARYLASLGEPGGQTADDILRSATADEAFYLLPWQETWLVQPLIYAAELSEPTAAQLRDRMLATRGQPFLRAAAAVILSRLGRAEPTELGKIYDTSGPATQPEIVVALAHACDGEDRILRSVATDQPLYSWIVDSVSRGA